MIINAQLESLLADYTALLDTTTLAQEEWVAIGQEQRILAKILDDIRWQQLTDDQKQAKRKARVALLNEQSSQDGSTMEFTYESYVTELYDLLQATLRTIAEVDVATSSIILRLKAFLLAEKCFIDADSNFFRLRHMDYYLWQNFFQANAPQLASMQIATISLTACFHAMYRSWPKRPYKEVEWYVSIGELLLPALESGI